MFNLPPLHSTKRIDSKIIPEVLKSWQIGQILESRAKTSSNAEGELQLQVGKQLLDAKTKIPIVAGQELTLQITKLGDTPVLKILNSPVQTDPITLLLRQAVPQNNSVQKLINLISHITQLIPDVEAAKTPASASPAQVTDHHAELMAFSRQIRSLSQMPVNASDISAPSIQRFLQQSGISLENQLLTTGMPDKNLKLELMQLKQSVSQILSMTDDSTIIKNPPSLTTTISGNQLPALASYLLYAIPAAEKSSIIGFLSNPGSFNPGTLSNSQSAVFQAIQKLTPAQAQQLKQWLQFIPFLSEMRLLVEQSINTINNHQLQALQADADSAFMLLFNLLVAKNPDWTDLFNIRISKEEKQNQDEEHWLVTVQMDMPDLGLMQARLVLINKQLHAGVSSQSAITHQIIDENIGLLESALTQAGFDVATITCKQEVITPIDKNRQRHGPLLDDKA
ncbi:MAG: flagellar hook-length control protein FliK [Gammaproteobacteria bacterium]|nr:flagellar hook-length control protein FliK [Gammaproteobacteria bacterium]